jgi:NADPH:quinone reductase-like Zn-dependent oxidoreductase
LAKSFSEGQRVAFFPAMGSWAECVVVRNNSLLPVPDEMSDPTGLPVYILQNAAASAVGRLLTQVALDRGIRPIRLVRSDQSAERLRSVLPGPPVYSMSDSNWKEQVREALRGHRLEVAFDALGGKAIDDLAELVDDGGTIINFGSLGSNVGTNIYSLVPNSLALKSVSIMSWFRLAEGEKRKDFELALVLAKTHPELFEVAHEYEFGDFQKAIQHVPRPGKTGIVLFKSPA